MIPRCSNCDYADECLYGQRHPRYTGCPEWTRARVDPGGGAIALTVYCALATAFALGLAWLKGCP